MIENKRRSGSCTWSSDQPQDFFLWKSKPYTITYNRVPQAHGSAVEQNRHQGQDLLNLMAKPVDKFR